MSNITSLDNKQCVGCRSCEQSCPKHCITFEESKEGFIYPKVSNLCINCGICEKHCPIINFSTSEKIEQKAKIVILNNQELLLKSTSGGVFAGIALYVLENGGVVFGAGYDENLNVIQRQINNIDDVSLLQGSKYVASNTLRTFGEVKKLLIEGKTVLYSGTPCQIAGLKSFLTQDYENLICIDLVCHGVPSPKFFHNYIERMEKKNKHKIIDFKFRDKKANDGWGIKRLVAVTDDNNKKYINASTDYYFSPFIFGENYRESCYLCKYANLNRIGDFTIGDFWGVRKKYKDIPFRKGVSMVLINTKKGSSFFSKFNGKFNVYDGDVNDFIKENANLIHPVVRPDIRDNFYENIEHLSFQLKVVFERYKLGYIFKMTLVQCLPKKLLYIIRKIRGSI